jgi:hypothetical protein
MTYINVIYKSNLITRPCIKIIGGMAKKYIHFVYIFTEDWKRWSISTLGITPPIVASCRLKDRPEAIFVHMCLLLLENIGIFTLGIMRKDCSSVYFHMELSWRIIHCGGIDDVPRDRRQYSHIRVCAFVYLLFMWLDMMVRKSCMELYRYRF